jgi:hypothetical protein
MAGAENEPGFLTSPSLLSLSHIMNFDCRKFPREIGPR